MRKKTALPQPRDLHRRFSGSSPPRELHAVGIREPLESPVMTCRSALRILLAPAAIMSLGFAPSLAIAQVSPEPRPAGVTDSAIAAGRILYHGAAGCSVCHGEDGKGTADAPNLLGAVWMHGPGTYESLQQQILHGVPANRSVSGVAMPIRGWIPMNNAEVEAVAAYVWSISHPPRSP